MYTFEKEAQRLINGDYPDDAFELCFQRDQVYTLYTDAQSVAKAYLRLITAYKEMVQKVTEE